MFVFFFLSFRTSSTNLQHIKCNNGTFLFFTVYSLNVGFKIIFSIHPYYVRYFCLCSVKMNGRWFCLWQIPAFFLVCVTHFITCFTPLGIWGHVSWYRCELKHKIMKRKSMLEPTQNSLKCSHMGRVREQTEDTGTQRGNQKTRRMWGCRAWGKTLVAEQRLSTMSPEHLCPCWVHQKCKVWILFPRAISWPCACRKQS